MPGRHKPSRAGGFSLIELVVVIAILGILATAVVVNTHGYDDKARAATTRSDLAAIRSASQLYKLDHGSYPASLQVLYDSGYVETLPIDPWTREPYLSESTSRGFRAYSLGRDQAEGGEGLDADVWSDQRS